MVPTWVAGTLSLPAPSALGMAYGEGLSTKDDGLGRAALFIPLPNKMSPPWRQSIISARSFVLPEVSRPSAVQAGIEPAGRKKYR